MEKPAVHQAAFLNLPRTRSIDVDFSDITFTVNGPAKSQKKVLHGISGCFRSGEVTAIMGPSGAGKTTLLNLLSGFLSEGMEGSVKTNGTPRNISVFRKSSCYILQTDQLHPCFTVLEVLNMAASLKLGPGMTRKGRALAVENVLEALGLTSCINTRATMLSGGQQKRLSIALELLDNPPVMFLDEPTTGLDSSASVSCVELMSRLARGGRTVVCTLHQPSARMFELIDHVYVVSRGLCIYQGDSKMAVPFLNSVDLPCPRYHNPADFLLEVATGQLGDVTDRLSEEINKSTELWRRPKQRIVPNTAVCGETTSVLLRAQKHGVSEWSKFCVLLHRSFLIHSRNWTTTHLKMTLHLVVGVLIGLLYGDSGQNGSRTISNFSFFLVTCVYLAYTAMMPAVVAFPSEMNVLRKERFNNWYSLRTYYAAFTVADTPMQIMFCSLYVLVAYFLSSQEVEFGRFIRFFAAAVLVSLVAESVGLLLGACCNQVNGTFIGAYSTALWILLTGFLLLIDHTPDWLRWMHYISYLRYAFEALAISQYGDNRETLWCPDDKYCHFKYPVKVMKEIGLNESNYWLDLGILSSCIVVLRVLTYWRLRKRLDSHSC